MTIRYGVGAAPSTELVLKGVLRVIFTHYGPELIRDRLEQAASELEPLPTRVACALKSRATAGNR